MDMALYSIAEMLVKPSCANVLSSHLDLKVVLRSKNTYFFFGFQNFVYETLPLRNFRP